MAFKANVQEFILVLQRACRPHSVVANQIDGVSQFKQHRERLHQLARRVQIMQGPQAPDGITYRWHASLTSQAAHNPLRLASLQFPLQQNGTMRCASIDVKALACWHGYQ